MHHAMHFTFLHFSIIELLATALNQKERNCWSDQGANCCFAKECSMGSVPRMFKVKAEVRTSLRSKRDGEDPD